jgi:hypothetical protein
MPTMTKKRPTKRPNKKAAAANVQTIRIPFRKEAHCRARIRVVEALGRFRACYEHDGPTGGLVVGDGLESCASASAYRSASAALGKFRDFAQHCARAGRGGLTKVDKRRWAIVVEDLDAFAKTLCPRGGVHEWDREGDCKKCFEPRPKSGAAVSRGLATAQKAATSGRASSKPPAKRRSAEPARNGGSRGDRPSAKRSVEASPRKFTDVLADGVERDRRLIRETSDRLNGTKRSMTLVVQRPAKLVQVMAGDEPLSDAERDELSTAEETIRNAFRSFVDAGQALDAIQEKRLYRDTHPSFQAYCDTAWGFGQAYAYRLIAAARATLCIKDSPIGEKLGVLPATESQARPLAKIDPKDQPKVWAAIVKDAPVRDGKPIITANAVEQHVREWSDPDQPLTVHRAAAAGRPVPADPHDESAGAVLTAANGVSRGLGTEQDLAEHMEVFGLPLLAKVGARAVVDADAVRGLWNGQRRGYARLLGELRAFVAMLDVGLDPDFGRDLVSLLHTLAVEAADRRRLPFPCRVGDALCGGSRKAR